MHKSSFKEWWGRNLRRNSVAYLRRYNWSQNKGPMALIYDTDRIAGEFSGCPPYLSIHDQDTPKHLILAKQRKQRWNLWHPSQAGYPAATILSSKALFKALGRIHLRDVFEEQLYQDLECVRFGCDNVWLEQWKAEIKSHCPLGAQAIKGAKARLYPGFATTGSGPSWNHQVVQDLC